MNQKQTLDISWGTILKVSVALFCFYIIYLVRDILVLSTFGLILSVLFNPAIDFLQRYRLPRFLAAAFLYVSIFAVLSLLIYLLFPAIFVEIKQLSLFFPQYFEKISPPLQGLGIEAFESMESFLTAMGEFLQKASADIFSALSAIFGGIGSAFFVIAVAFFISLEEGGIERLLALVIPKVKENSALEIWKKCQAKASGWFGSRILSGIFVAILAFIAFKLFNVRYAFTLSILTGILDIVPVLGPIIAGAISFVFVVLDSWLKAIFVLGALVLIQQIEGNILTPILAQKFIGLPPALVLISLAIGGRLLGILGAILAIPIAGILFEFWKDFLRERREKL
jgi:predicted PurR-regulated permease PerM